MWVTPSVRSLVQSELSFPLVEPLTPLPQDLQTLVVVGGGYLIDEAKAWRQDHAHGIHLVAIPSLWGSGAEASPIIVQNREGKKVIRMEAEFLPNTRVIWPELADTIPEARARMALGDCWANAIEGFLSPLASDTLRRGIAVLVKHMQALPLGKDARWFELSAQASAAQAQSSVGLVHGIAHALEGLLCATQPEARWGHAKLCSVYLWPVLRFILHHSEDPQKLLETYGMDITTILDIAKKLYDDMAYDQALPTLEVNWKTVLRDPCTRTNSMLVKLPHLSYFQAKSFV